MGIREYSVWNKDFCLSKLLASAFAVVSAVFCLPHVLTAQHAKPKEQKEQSDFGIELEAVPVQRPVTLPRAALDVLSRDARVASCLENDALRPEELPANWFVASEIHLDGANESDLAVLPGDRLPDTPNGEISPNACLLGANTAQMWVLRKTPHGFKLVLSQTGLGMSVLTTKTNGLRDIHIGAVVGGYDDFIEYRFDRDSYKIAGRTSKLIGAELPHSLSVFKTRKVIVQSSGQSSEIVRGQARAWIWHQWQGHKTSYLAVRIRDEASEETSRYFLAPDENGEWQVTIQAHRSVRDKNATASRLRISVSELLVAPKIQRVEPTADEMHIPQVFSEGEIISESKYRLQFLDYGSRIVGVL